MQNMRILKSEDDNIIVREYPKDKLEWLPRVKVDGGYLTIFGTFDIETTNIIIDDKPNAIMYIWQICIGDVNGNNRAVYVGRTWADLHTFMIQLIYHYKLYSKRKMIFFIHNSAFEFQFIRSVFSITKMFPIKKRVPIYFDIEDAIEFRCSYKLSNMSLDKFTQEEKAIHGKQKGFDYSVERYADTELSDKDLLYCVDDVLGLHEAVTHLLHASNDNLLSLPCTSTGFVKREARGRVQSNKKNYYTFQDTKLNAEQYKYCKASARGGNTHANPLYSGQIIGYEHKRESFVLSYDKVSSYPYEMLTGKYPVGKLVEERSQHIIDGCANIIDIAFINIRLKKGVYFPYIAKNKCQYLPKSDFRKFLYDNGRIIKAESLRMVCTDIDLAIIRQQYEFDSEIILNQYVSEYGFLNREYRQYVYELFKSKCELKGGDPYLYAKFKNKINALFGMMLTDITRENIQYIDDKWVSDLPPSVLSLYRYYKNYKSFLSYQHGIYVTANARRSLQTGLDAVGIDGIYCDTDSVKFLNDHSKEFEEINKKIIAHSESVGVKSVVVNGKSNTIGIWELDASYSAFITHGSKKYAYKYSMDDCNGKHKGEYGVTVSGLNKKQGKEYIEMKGGLKAFHPSYFDENGIEHKGLEFDELNSGRLTAVYNDTVQLKTMSYNGHKIELTSNVALVPTTYTLGITQEYNRLLGEVGNWVE